MARTSVVAYIPTARADRAPVVLWTRAIVVSYALEAETLFGRESKAGTVTRGVDKSVPCPSTMSFCPREHG